MTITLHDDRKFPEENLKGSGVNVFQTSTNANITKTIPQLLHYVVDNDLSKN